MVWIRFFQDGSVIFSKAGSGIFGWLDPDPYYSGGSDPVNPNVDAQPWRVEGTHYLIQLAESYAECQISNLEISKFPSLSRDLVN